MKQQLVVTQKIRQNEIPALLDSAVMNTPSVKMLSSKKIFFVLIFSTKKYITYMLEFWSFEDRSSFFSVSNTIVYRCVRTNRCFIGDVINPSFQLSLNSYS